MILVYFDRIWIFIFIFILKKRVYQVMYKSVIRYFSPTQPTMTLSRIIPIVISHEWPNRQVSSPTSTRRTASRKELVEKVRGCRRSPGSIAVGWKKVLTMTTTSAPLPDLILWMRGQCRKENSLQLKLVYSFQGVEWLVLSTLWPASYL